MRVRSDLLIHMTMTALICVELEETGAFGVIDVGECTKNENA